MKLANPKSKEAVRKRRRVPGCAVMLAAATLASAPAAAQGGTSTWQFEVTPYLWASAMKGSVQAGALPNTNVNLSFADIVENLDFGFMGTIETRKDRWGILFDALYMNVSDSATATRTGAGPAGATLTANADARVKQGMVSGALAYRIADGPTAVDMVGGARYNRIDASATINASLFGLAGFVTRTGDRGWWDPYIGARVLHRLDDRWTLVGYADVGGFGVGSDFAWQALAGFNYAFSSSVTGKIGYRYISVDYDKGGILYDMQTQGIVIGVGMRF